MSKTRFSKHLLRVLGLITLGAMLVIVAPANRMTTVPFPLASPVVSPTPVPTPNAERPNPVRRFFSWVGGAVSRPFRRHDPVPPISDPPIVFVKASKSLITFCPVWQVMETENSCSPDRQVELSATIGSPEDDARSLFLWNVTVGRLSPDQGTKVTWNLSGVKEGTYTASVEWNDGNQLTAYGSTKVTIASCSRCYTIAVPCPNVSVACPSIADPKQPMTFLATVAGGNSDVKPTYTWSVTNGKIISGQGTSKITVDASDFGQRSTTGIVTVSGDYNPLCSGLTASCRTN